MAKGKLFALVRKGSKLNYLDDGNNQSDCERKHTHENVNRLFKVNSREGMIGRKTTELRSTQQLQTATGKAESKRKGRRLFDMRLQKFSRGCKTHRNPPACSNNNESTDSDAFTSKQRDMPKSDYLSKDMLVPSVASGYFVHEISSSNSKEPTSKKHGNGTLMPRIVLTDHDEGNLTKGKTVETNRSRIQYYSRYSSFPQLQVEKRRKRPSSWKDGESSPKLKDFTNTRSRTDSVELESICSNSSNSKIKGLYVEAIPISTSPFTERRNNGSTKSLRSQDSQPNSLDSTIELCSRAVKSDTSLSIETKNRSVKRASSWSRGDEKLSEFNERQNARRIDIFLPTV